MANPSTEGGTGAGTEVLRRFYKTDLTSTEVKIIDGVADHIYTVLSICILERGNQSDHKFFLGVNPEGNASNRVDFLYNQAIGGRELFMWNDKVVLTGTDELVISASAGSSNFDVWCSYIDQTFA